MIRTIFSAALLLAAQAAVAQPAPAAAPKSGPPQPALCTACHTLEAQQMGGYFESAAFKSQSLQLDVGAGAPQILRFDAKALKVLDAGAPKSAEHLKDVKKRHEAQVSWVERDGVKVVTEIRFKGPAKIDPDKLIDFAGVARLVAGGPGTPAFTLIDSRPLPRFQEGAIPGAIHLPFIGFDKFVNRLPADKNQLVVFYCGGITCTLSPNSLRKAQKLGYTQLRVYREGMPEWQTRSFAVLTPRFLKDAYVDKDIPHVLLDSRGAEAAASGHIPGAVASADLKSLTGSLPAAGLKAPLIIYDGRGGEQAAALARQLVQAGQQNVLVLQGGLLGWQAAGHAIESGKPAATRVAYAPKPRAGSLPAAEFTTLARATPAGVLILDVRNPDEAAGGMIKGAVLIPDEELTGRLAELPKDKRIVAHCLTGIRAEMAYHKLKAAGYNAAFLNAEIDIAKDGSFKLTPR